MSSCRTTAATEKEVASLKQQAEAAVDAAEYSEAKELYARALVLKPNDAALKQDYQALLETLEQVSYVFPLFYRQFYDLLIFSSGRRK